MPKLKLAGARRIKTDAGEILALKGMGFSWRNKTLQSFYGVGPGKVAIHFDVESAVRDGTGNITALKNRGGGGAYFDAAVSGSPIPIGADGKTLNMAPSGGVPILANPASLDGVRLIWVTSVDGLGNGMRLFGSAADEIRLGGWVAGPPRQAAMQMWSNRSGAGVTASASPKWILPATGLHLLEIETDLTADTAAIYADGVQVATATGVTHSAFTVDRLGQGVGGGGAFSGQLGDVLGVTLGAGADAAIAAARVYLAGRHGILLA